MSESGSAAAQAVVNRVNEYCGANKSMSDIVLDSQGDVCFVALPKKAAVPRHVLCGSTIVEVSLSPSSPGAERVP